MQPDAVAVRLRWALADRRVPGPARSRAGAYVATAVMGLVFGLLALPPTRWIMQHTVLPKPGQVLPHPLFPFLPSTPPGSLTHGPKASLFPSNEVDVIGHYIYVAAALLPSLDPPD